MLKVRDGLSYQLFKVDSVCASGALQYSVDTISFQTFSQTCLKAVGKNG